MNGRWEGLGLGLTICFSLSPPTVLDLETGEVGVGLDLFNERHLSMND